MKLFWTILFGILIVLTLMVPLVGSLKIPGEVTPSPPAEYRYSPGRDISANVEVIHHAEGAVVSRQNYEDSSRTPIRSEEFTTSSRGRSEYPVELKKIVLPNHGEGYLVDEPVDILVEIKHLGGNPIYNIGIYEHINSDFELMNYSQCYIASSPSDRFFIEDSLRNFGVVAPFENNKTINMLFDNEFNTISTKLPSLKLKQRAIYLYKIKPKGRGIYTTDTIICFGDTCSIYPDLDSPSLNILVNDQCPEFEVNLDVTQFEMTTKEKLDIIYDITYVGGAFDICDNIKVKLDDTNHNYKFVNNSGKFNSVYNTTHHIDLILNQPVRLNKTVVYSKDGIYSLPGIQVNGKHYAFKEEQITVKTWTQRHITTIGIIVAILGVILGEIYGNTIESYTRERFKKKPKD